MPEVEAYWKISWISRIPFFGYLLPRDHFQEIVWLLHLSQPVPSCPERKTHEIMMLLDLRLSKFQEHFCPFQDLSAEETMVGSRGRFSSTQYTPKKPIKWSIKAFTLADAKTGYMLNIFVYTGAQTVDDADPQFAHLPVLCQSVLHLVSP